MESDLLEWASRHWRGNNIKENWKFWWAISFPDVARSILWFLKSEGGSHIIMPNNSHVRHVKQEPITPIVVPQGQVASFHTSPFPKKSARGLSVVPEFSWRTMKKHDGHQLCQKHFFHKCLGSNIFNFFFALPERDLGLKEFLFMQGEQITQSKRMYRRNSEGVLI